MFQSSCELLSRLSSTAIKKLANRFKIRKTKCQNGISSVLFAKHLLCRLNQPSSDLILENINLVVNRTCLQFLRRIVRANRNIHRTALPHVANKKASPVTGPPPLHTSPRSSF